MTHCRNTLICSIYIHLIYSKRNITQGTVNKTSGCLRHTKKASRVHRKDTLPPSIAKHHFLSACYPSLSHHHTSKGRHSSREIKAVAWGMLEQWLHCILIQVCTCTFQWFLVSTYQIIFIDESHPLRLTRCFFNGYWHLKIMFGWCDGAVA